ncbi:MAG: hypothetical protein ACKO0V_20860 [bacterium]
MTEAFIEMTEDEFDNEFHLITNHINPWAGWAVDDRGGCLFETYGPEFDYVRRSDLSRVWTLIDGEDGDMYLVSGLHDVNRVGYLITVESVPPSTFIQVHLPMQQDNIDQDFDE